MPLDRPCGSGATSRPAASSSPIEGAADQSDALAGDGGLHADGGVDEEGAALPVDLDALAREPQPPVVARLDVQQAMLHQIGGLLDAAFARQQARAGDRHQIVVEQLLAHQAGIASVAVAHREVDLLDLEVEQPGRGIDAHVDIGVKVLELLQPRHQPLHREARRAGDADRARHPPGGQFLGGGCDLVERSADSRRGTRDPRRSPAPVGRAGPARESRSTAPDFGLAG